MNRRTFLKVLGASSAAATAGLPMMRAFANPIAPAANGDFFLFIHAQGGWDVTLWSDPRNTQHDMIVPGTGGPSGTIDTSLLYTDPATQSFLRAHVDPSLTDLWTDTPLLDGSGQDTGDTTFQILQPRGAGQGMQFGPGIGGMIRHYDKLCVVNGVSMDTVSHPDGTVFSSTGRHLSGSRASQSSIDTIVANEFGRDALFPVVSVQFPSWFVGANMDPRVSPLKVGALETIGRSLYRSSAFDTAEQRDLVTVMLTQEAQDLAARSYYPDVPQSAAIQFQSLRNMLQPQADGSTLVSLFEATGAGSLASKAYLQPIFQTLPPNAAGVPQTDPAAIDFAFAVEAMRRNVVRCVSFAYGGFDTHTTNYQTQCQTQQRLFNLLANTIDALAASPSPNHPGETLLAHTHIMVISDFCRHPTINASQGRDHYPNNTVLVVSPRFKQNYVFGSSDPGQLLPATNVVTDAAGPRAITPTDVLQTFLAGVGVDPDVIPSYLRDGMIVRDLLSGM